MSFLVCRNGDLLPDGLSGAVVAIGNFDGVHRGHQKLIAIAREEALRLGAASAALTFEPHPRQFFKPKTPLFRLTKEVVKLSLLERFGLTGAFVASFDEKLAALTADEFLRQYLLATLRASGIVIGHDFHFGRDRGGTSQHLEDFCRMQGMTCHVVEAVTDHGRPISSSAIRFHLEQGEVAAANELLGYAWFVREKVQHGDKRGRDLGYPTANLCLGEDCRLRHGIYAVQVVFDDNSFQGVASYGRRPTFDNGSPLLEVHLFDFAGDLYGRTLDVIFHGWIRGEERFETIEALVRQMDLDSEQAKRILAAANLPKE